LRRRRYEKRCGKRHRHSRRHSRRRSRCRSRRRRNRRRSRRRSRRSCNSGCLSTNVLQVEGQVLSRSGTSERRVCVQTSVEDEGCAGRVVDVVSTTPKATWSDTRTKSQGFISSWERSLVGRDKKRKRNLPHPRCRAKWTQHINCRRRTQTLFQTQTRRLVHTARREYAVTQKVAVAVHRAAAHVAQHGVVGAVLVWRTSQWVSLEVSAGVGQIPLVEEATGTEVTEGILGSFGWAGRPTKRVDIRRVVGGWIGAIVLKPAGESEEQWKGCDCFDDHSDGLGSLLGTKSTDELSGWGAFSSGLMRPG